MYRIVVFLYLFLSGFILCAQDGYTKEQLFALLKQPVADTVRVDAYNELCWPVYSYDNKDSSLYYGKKAIELATKIDDIKRLSIAHRRIGITYTNFGEAKASIKHEQLSYELSEKINFKRGMQLALNNIGVAYMNSELLNKALSYFLKSLKIAEESGNTAGLGSMYFNCAQVYRRTGNIRKSNEYLLKTKQVAEVKHDTNLISLAYTNLSTGYRNLHILDSARYYLNLAKTTLNAQSSNSAKFNYYLNEALFLVETGEHRKALEAFLKMRPYATALNDEITLLINIAEEYATLKDQAKALDYFKEAYALSLKIKTYNNLAYISYAIAGIYEARGDYKKSAEMMRLHLTYKDSADQHIRVQQIAQQQLEFDYQRKQVSDSLRFEHKEKLKNAELQVAEAKLHKEKYFRILLVVLLVFIVLFAAFIYNRFLLAKKQKQIIEGQKQIVELKNREILDSINYAKRLQSAILPQISDIRRELELAILYLPKDIIGGDFYFFEKHGGYTFFAVCDCTGHGIPGALMSVVCHNALQKSIKEFGLNDPGEILNKTREIVIDNLNATHQNIKDGMDCSLLAIHDTTKRVTWAGANNHVWIFNQAGLNEIKADKQPVAFYENSRAFQTQELQIENGSYVCLFTDGYGDQFGGKDGKKFKSKSLKQLLVSVAEHPVDTQVELLQQNFLSWRRDLDQVDDVAVSVIRF